VVAAANPRRGLAADAATVSDLVSTVDGPVVLAGHPYGGAVISDVDADADAGDLDGLVYVAGFAPEPGESACSLAGMFPARTAPSRSPARPTRSASRIPRRPRT